MYYAPPKHLYGEENYSYINKRGGNALSNQQQRSVDAPQNKIHTVNGRANGPTVPSRLSATQHMKCSSSCVKMATTAVGCISGYQVVRRGR